MNIIININIILSIVLVENNIYLFGKVIKLINFANNINPLISYLNSVDYWNAT